MAIITITFFTLRIKGLFKFLNYCFTVDCLCNRKERPIMWLFEETHVCAISSLSDQM